MPRPNGRNPRYGCFWFALISIVALCGPLAAQKRTKDIPLPTEFEIGRLTYFDFGPPFDYYELLFVRPKEQGTSVERMILTPHGVGVFRPRLRSHKELCRSPSQPFSPA